MNDLIAFINARLDEEEAVARAALADLKEDMLTWDGFVQGGWKASGLIADDDLFDYLDVCGPTAAVAGVAADRAILARYEALGRPAGLFERLMFPALAGVALACIRDRASRFAGHPDYRDEFRPATQ